jgi:arsenite methyltransferase
LSSLERQLARRRGNYGFDAPYVPTFLGLIGIASLIFGLIGILLPLSPILDGVCLIYGAFMLLSAASYIYTTRRGKFQVWAEILAHLGLHGDEHVLDLGCGRGAVLLMAANLLPTGKAMGVDLWKSSDQSGNAISVTRHNAELEGVADRVELHTADMQNIYES